MTKYQITYDVEIDSTDPYEAVFWLQQVIRKPELQLPDHVYWVRTVPQVTDVTDEPPKTTPKPKKTKEEANA